MNTSLLFALLNFMVLVFFLHRFLRQPVATFFQTRAKEIETELERTKTLMTEASAFYESAQSRFQKLETEVESIRQMIRTTSKHEASIILERAKRQSARMISDAEALRLQEEARSFKAVRHHALERAFEATHEELKKGLSEERQRFVVNTSIADLEKLQGFGMDLLATKEEHV